MKAKIYHLNGKEVHIVAECVAVVWRTIYEKRELKGEDGLTYRAEVAVRDGDPYIDFVWIREDSKGEVFQDEDNPVAGGLSADYALKLAHAIQEAVKYYRFLYQSGQQK